MHTHTPTLGKIVFHAMTFLLSSMAFLQLYAQSPNDLDDEKLLDEYIASDGFNQKIVFDSKNIKQYWIDHSVFSKDNLIHILFGQGKAKKYESGLLNIQLSNVTENLDCKIYVVTNNADYSFSVLDKKNKVVSSSKDNDKIMNYSIDSALVHLESVSGFSFSLQFQSNTLDMLNINKIVLAFSKNPNSSFLVSPGDLSISPANCTVTGSSSSESKDSDWDISGKQVSITSNNKIYLYDNTLSSSVKIKNTGTVPAQVYLGYVPYSKDQTRLDGRNYPYRINGENLKVVSAKAGDKTIVVESLPAQWTKNALLALNAKEDYSDIPNFTIVPGKIDDIKPLENGHAEILISEPLTTGLETGSQIRIHGKRGTSLYTKTLKLSPGEEQEIITSLKLDNDCLYFSSTAFSRGTYYVVPFIRFSTIGSDEDSSIKINDFRVSY